jgi:hypothetical protein
MIAALAGRANVFKGVVGCRLSISFLISNVAEDWPNIYLGGGFQKMELFEILSCRSANMCHPPVLYSYHHVCSGPLSKLLNAPHKIHWDVQVGRPHFTFFFCFFLSRRSLLQALGHFAVASRQKEPRCKQYTRT